MALPKILVVDDEEVMRDVLGSVLGGEGYAVSFAPTGPDAPPPDDPQPPQPDGPSVPDPAQ